MMSARAARELAGLHPRLVELRDYISEHGHLPPGGQHPGPLGNYCRNVRALGPAGGPHLRAQLDAYLELADGVPSFKEYHWDATYAKVLSFCEEHGHRPATSRQDTDTSRLAEWVANQQKLIGAASRLPSQIEKLHRILAFPTATEAAWADRVEKIGQHHKVTGRLPKSTENNTLYLWMKRQVLLYRRGDLSKPQMTAIENLPGLLSSDSNNPVSSRHRESAARRSVQAWDRRWEELKAFVEVNGVLPQSSRSTPPSEHSLATWVSHQRKVNREGGLLSYQAELLSGLPLFLRSRSNPIRAIEEFEARNGRLPEESSANSAGSALGQKLRVLRTRHQLGAWDRFAPVPAFIEVEDKGDGVSLAA